MCLLIKRNYAIKPVVPVSTRLSLAAQGSALPPPMLTFVTLNFPLNAPFRSLLSVCSICWLYVLSGKVKIWKTVRVVLRTLTARLPFVAVGATVVVAVPSSNEPSMMFDVMIRLLPCTAIWIFCAVMLLLIGKLPMLLPNAASDEAGISIYEAGLLFVTVFALLLCRACTLLLLRATWPDGVDVPVTPNEIGNCSFTASAALPQEGVVAMLLSCPIGI